MEYLLFGETLVDEHINSKNSPFKYNGKEYDEETGNYYYGARYYDPKLSIFISVDPLTENYPDTSPYAYVANNPIVLVDPDGRDIYRHDEETGEIVLFKTTNDETDMIGKFEKKKDENGNYVLKTNGKGEAKSRIDNIEKGILKDGINFKYDYNQIELGAGPEKASEQGVIDFLVAYTDEIAGVEVSGYALGGISSDEITSIYLEPHRKGERDGNTLTSCNSLGLDKNSNLDGLNSKFQPKEGFKGRVYTKYHFHTHPKYGTDIDNPSKEDRRAHARNNIDHYIFNTNGTHKYGSYNKNKK